MMGMCKYSDIFQSKVENIFCDTKGVETHIENMVLLIKNIFTMHFIS